MFDFGQYTWRNAVSANVTGANWADIAEKIAKKTIGIDTIVARYGCGLNIGRDTTEYVIAKLEEQRPLIKNLIERGRVKTAINRLKDSLARCGNNQGGLMGTSDVGCMPGQIRTSQGLCIDTGMPSQSSSNADVIGILTSLFGRDQDGVPDFEEGMVVYTGGKPDGSTNKKGWPWYYYAGIGVGAVALIATVVIVSKNRNKG